MRDQFDLKAAVDELTLPRVLHTTQQHPETKSPTVRSIAHPPLVDLLESSTGTARGSGQGRGTGGRPGPIDAGALETWGEIRDQVRVWLRQLGKTWSDDLKADLRAWYLEHEVAVALGRADRAAVDEIERIIAGWLDRIRRKYDPDERREWTEPCPAVLNPYVAGRPGRCGARRIHVDGVVQFAIALNVTQRTAECRSCGTQWEGARGLMMLRYETNLVEAEDLVVALLGDGRSMREKELALTSPISLP